MRKMPWTSIAVALLLALLFAGLSAAGVPVQEALAIVVAGGILAALAALGVALLLAGKGKGAKVLHEMISVWKR